LLLDYVDAVSVKGARLLPMGGNVDPLSECLRLCRMVIRASEDEGSREHQRQHPAAHLRRVTRWPIVVGQRPARLAFPEGVLAKHTETRGGRHWSVRIDGFAADPSVPSSFGRRECHWVFANAAPEILVR